MEEQEPQTVLWHRKVALGATALHIAGTLVALMQPFIEASGGHRGIQTVQVAEAVITSASIYLTLGDLAFLFVNSCRFQLVAWRTRKTNLNPSRFMNTTPYTAADVFTAAIHALSRWY